MIRKYKFETREGSDNLFKALVNDNQSPNGFKPIDKYPNFPIIVEGSKTSIRVYESEQGEDYSIIFVTYTSEENPAEVSIRASNVIQLQTIKKDLELLTKREGFEESKLIEIGEAA